ncbi:MAG: 3-dehydroquinate synthase [Flavobacteriales bacterium]|nr:3-dehydroquinate synthase [Flavobacteriales bacterium]
MNKRYFHRVKKGSYSLHPVFFGSTTLQELIEEISFDNQGYSSIFALIDSGVPAEKVTAFLGNEFPASNRYVVEGGESVKSLASIAEIWDFLMVVGADRHSLLVNIGGGAVCDAGGFAASVFKRGIHFMHVPTTLLSMADASVGGKTAINWSSTKNMIGTFALPAVVSIQSHFLESLDRRQLLSGYAEMIKHGLIADDSHYEEVLKSYVNGEIPSECLLENTVNIKAKITERDPKENGERKLLNFGHTLGHGLESLLGAKEDKGVLHGEAIAAGMIGEAYLSMEYGFSQEELEKLITTLKPLVSHAYFSEDQIPSILESIKQDKKNEGNRIGMTLLKGVGEGLWTEKLSIQKVEEGLRFIVKVLSNQTK